MTARVPAGHVQVTLESRDALNSGAWCPWQRLSGQGGVLTFNLPRAGRFAVRRIRADAVEELPFFLNAGALVTVAEKIGERTEQSAFPVTRF